MYFLNKKINTESIFSIIEANFGSLFSAKQKPFQKDFTICEAFCEEGVFCSFYQKGNKLFFLEKAIAKHRNIS